MRRIGVLMGATEAIAVNQARLTAFLEGYSNWAGPSAATCGSTIRWAAGDPDRFRTYAAELVALAPDVILASASASVAALQQASRSVPIVFANVIDPVGAGLVASLAQPGGNATGFTAFEYGISGKWLELLKEIAPHMTRVAVVRDPALAAVSASSAAIQSVAPSSGVELSRDRRARRRRDRARRRCIRAQAERRPDRDGERVGAHSSRSDHRACHAAPPAGGLSVRYLSLNGGLPPTGLIRSTSSARGRLRRPHPQGREASRPAGAGADQV